MSKYIKKIGLPSTVYNTNGSEHYARLCKIRTHIANNNVMINKEMFDYRTLLYFNVFSFTVKTFSQTNLIIRLKTSERDSNNIFITNSPTNFELVYTIEEDGSYIIYVKCNSNEKVKLQLIEGFDGFVKYYYESPFNIDLPQERINKPNLINIPFGNVGSTSIKVNSTNTGIIVETPVGGDGFCPARDGSIAFGRPDRKWKGGYFSEIIQVPVKIPLTNVPTNPQNGFTFFQATLKKLLTYYEGKWYADGEEVKLV